MKKVRIPKWVLKEKKRIQKTAPKFAVGDIVKLKCDVGARENFGVVEEIEKDSEDYSYYLSISSRDWNHCWSMQDELILVQKA